MLLGSKYRNKEPLEFFLRTMNAGTFSIQDIRNKYHFITDSKFFEIIRECSAKKIISVDKRKKEITFSLEVARVISFIEKTDFVNQMEIYKQTGKIPSKIKSYLDKIGFEERMQKKCSKDDSVINFSINDELDNCLMSEYNNSFINAIISLDLKVKDKKVVENNER